jgi:hypothetical protein
VTNRVSVVPVIETWTRGTGAPEDDDADDEDDDVVVVVDDDEEVVVEDDDDGPSPLGELEHADEMTTPDVTKRPITGAAARKRCKTFRMFDTRSPLDESGVSWSS